MRRALLPGAFALVALWPGQAVADAAAAAIAPSFEHMPINPPHVLTGNFGEARTGRYHGGVDFSTGGGVGRAVYAPAAGYIARVRASGVGFGRSIYLHTADGRLVVLAHLDAYDEPLASWMAAVQESTGRYEQDLWAAAGRFPVAAGQRLGWTGASGAGPPHLHVEVRRGDVAYNPLRAGLQVSDTHAPQIRHLTLEPLDDRSFVNRSAAPLTLPVTPWVDTVLVEGRVRCVLDARDRQDDGRYRLIPWASGVRFGGATVTCQFDSATWGGDIGEADMVYDRGRAASGNGLVLWRSSDHVPRVILEEGFGPATALVVAAGDPPKSLEVFSRDTDGNESTHVVWLRGPRVDEIGPDTTRSGAASPARGETGRFTFTILPERFVRVDFAAPVAARGVRIAGQPASFEVGRWSAVLPFARVTDGAGVEVVGEDLAGDVWAERFEGRFAPDDHGRWSFTAPADFEWRLDADAVYEPALLVEVAGDAPRRSAEIVPFGDSWWLGPTSLALRGPVNVSIALPDGAPEERIAIYRSDGNGWTPVGGQLDRASRRLEATSRGLGRFAIFADTLAPRIGAFRPRRSSARGPYSRWALEARVREEGSGVDRDDSYFVVDGRRVPTEWDPESNRLRWRPLRRPKPGRHAYEVVATDEAGNQSRSSGTFVLD